MKDFDALFSEFESMDSLRYEFFLTETAKEVIPILKNAAEDGVNGSTIFFYYILCTITADGYFFEDEYRIIYPILHNLFSDTVNFDECKKNFKRTKRNTEYIQKYTDQMNNLLMLLTDKLKEDVILSLLLLCSVTKKITTKEKKFIKQLVYI